MQTTNATSAASRFIVTSSSASMPNSCWGIYRRVAVIEVEAGVESVPMISARAKGVIRVVKTWERLNVGKTPRCAFNRALAAAEAMADKLNAAQA